MTETWSTYVAFALHRARPQLPVADDVAARQAIEVTARLFGLEVAELLESRRRRVVTARQVAMAVVRARTDMSYPRIAATFGVIDHTTIVRGVQRVLASEEMTSWAAAVNADLDSPPPPPHGRGGPKGRPCRQRANRADREDRT